VRQPRDVEPPGPVRAQGAARDRAADLVPVWTFRRGLDLALVADVADGRAVEDVEPPDLRVRVLAADGGTLTVRVVDGVAAYDADELLYVPGRGPYEVLRRDVSPGRDGPRVVLTLAPFRR
jgi:hypothetical protein